MKKFRVSLCMPGAVTSGAYTAGVVDYLLETLEKWEVESQKENPRVPPMYAELSSSGGTSAGGMTSVMMLLQLMGKSGLLKDAWINLDDDDNETTLEKVLKTDDLESGKRVTSLLNSSFIDSITSKAFEFDSNIEDAISNLPKYISKDFNLVLSHTLLNGVPLSLKLGNEFLSTLHTDQGGESVDYVTYEHSFFSYYSINKDICYQSIDNSAFTFFNPFDKNNLKRMKIATQATGAFPVGLKPRLFKSDVFPKKLIVNSVKKSISSRYYSSFHKKINESEDFWKDVFQHVTDDFESLNVDGGGMNNAPIGQLLAMMREKESDTNLFGMIQIDPYPDRVKESSLNYKPNNNFIPTLASIVGALWSGNKTKRDEIVYQKKNDVVIGEIFPVQKNNGNSTVKKGSVLATSVISAFGGILDKSLRKHDYELGRENARNFLRYIYCFPANKNDEKSQDFSIVRDHWDSNEMAKELFIKRKRKFGNAMFLPIIPDVSLIDDETGGSNDLNSALERPKVSMQIIESNKKIIKKRIKSLLNNMNFTLKSDKPDLRRGRGLKFGVWIAKLFTGRIYKSIYIEIQDELDSKGLLDK